MIDTMATSWPQEMFAGGGGTLRGHDTLPLSVGDQPCPPHCLEQYTGHFPPRGFHGAPLSLGNPWGGLEHGRVPKHDTCHVAYEHSNASFQHSARKNKLLRWAHFPFLFSPEILEKKHQLKFWDNNGEKNVMSRIRPSKDSLFGSDILLMLLLFLGRALILNLTGRGS